MARAGARQISPKTKLFFTLGLSLIGTGGVAVGLLYYSYNSDRTSQQEPLTQRIAAANQAQLESHAIWLNEAFRFDYGKGVHEFPETKVELSEVVNYMPVDPGYQQQLIFMRAQLVKEGARRESAKEGNCSDRGDTDDNCIIAEDGRIRTQIVANSRLGQKFALFSGTCSDWGLNSTEQLQIRLEFLRKERARFISLGSPETASAFDAWIADYESRLKQAESTLYSCQEVDPYTIEALALFWQASNTAAMGAYIPNINPDDLNPPDRARKEHLLDVAERLDAEAGELSGEKAREVIRQMDDARRANDPLVGGD